MIERASYHHGNAKQALMAAALDIIEENGLGSFSLRATAKKVGVDPATCYRHFKNKESILHSIASQGFTQFSQAMARCEGKSPEQRLINMCHCYVDFACNQPLVFQIMFGGSGLPALDESLREDKVEKTSFMLLEEALKEWVDENDWQGSLEDLTMDIWATIHGLSSLLAFQAITIDETTITASINRLVHAILWHENK